MPKHLVGGLVLGIALSFATHAHAHFKMLKPASWLNEDQLGGPQKGSPCGPGNSRPFIGDDMQPAPTSGMVTTFKAGETIQVQLDETVYHPGYFRISLAKTAAGQATSADFPDPALIDSTECVYDKSLVKMTPHDNVLADGLFMAEETSMPGRKLMTDVKLPNEPCENCTLQVVQVMEKHGASSCFYFHCADIKIVAADGGSAGAEAAGSAAGSAGSASPDGPKAASEDDGGCDVGAPGARHAARATTVVLGLVAVLATIRRRTTRRR